MYQQPLQNQKNSSKLDLLLFILFIGIALFMRQITDFFTALPAPWNTAGQILLFLMFIGICLFVYKRRLCSYRYTVIFAPAPEGELDPYGNPLEWPWPIGTVLFERMVSNKGNLVEEVPPAELLALLSPGQAPESGLLENGGKKPNYFNTTRMTRYSAKKAHTLVFRRKGKIRYIAFHPDETMCGHIETLLAAKREAAAEQANG